jgi:hypothetical protein
MPIDTAPAPELLAATTAAVDGDMSVHHHRDEDDEDEDETEEDDSMNPTYSNTVRSKRRRKIQPNEEEEKEMTLSLPATQNDVEEDLRFLTQPPQQQQQQQLPDNRFELELEFVQALASPAYLHFLATSRLVMEDLHTYPPPSVASDNTTTTTTTATATATATATTNIGTTQQSTLQQLQPFLHYLYRTYSQPQYARFLRYPHALYMLHALLIPTTTTTTTTMTTTTYCEEDAATTTNTSTTTATSTTTMAHSHLGTTVPDGHDDHHQLWTEWTIPGFRNFAHQQQFLAWQHRHTVCYGVGTAPIPTPHRHIGASGDDDDGGGGSSSKSSSSSIKASTSTTSSSKKLETSSEIANNNNSNDSTMQPNEEKEEDHDVVTVDNSNIANT